MKYKEELDPALRNFSLVVNGGEKVGIVGRTGAGKSSILQVLFRMRSLERGGVMIDG